MPETLRMQRAEGVPSMTWFSGQRSRIELGVFATGCASPELQEEPRTGLSAFFPQKLAFFIIAKKAGKRVAFGRTRSQSYKSNFRVRTLILEL